MFALFATLPLLISFQEGALDIVVRQEVGVALTWGLALALAFGLVPGSAAGPDGRRALIALAVLAAWTALGLAWTSSAERSLAELARVLTYGALATALLCGLRRGDARAAAAGICAALLVLPLVAVVSRAAPDLLETGALGGFERLSYPLGYWNALACWSAMAVVAGLALSAGLRSPGLRAVSLAPVPVAGLALYLTFSRGGLVACAIGLAAALALARNRTTFAVHLLVAGMVAVALVLVARSQEGVVAATASSASAPLLLAITLAALGCAACGRATARRGLDRVRLPGRVAAGLVATVVAAALVAGALTGGKVVSDALAQFDAGTYPAQEGDPAARLTSLEGARREIWGSALGAFASHPALGLGPGTFEFWWARDVPGGEPLGEPHSLYLGALAEQGIPGLLAVLALAGFLLAGAARAAACASRSRDAALAAALAAAFTAYLVQAGVDWLWEQTALTMTALAGAAVASKLGGARPRAPRRPRGTAQAFLVLVAVLAGAVMVPAIVSTERIRASFSALVLGRPAESARIADEAVTAQPWAASPYAARALARLAGGRDRAALADARRAAAREPESWRHRVLIAGVAARSGDERLARRALAAARELRPGLELDPDRLLEPEAPGRGGAPPP